MSISDPSPRELKRLRIQVPGIASSVPVYLKSLGSFLDELSVSSEERSAIMIAGEEVFVNVIRHAYVEERGDVVVTLAARDREIEITLSDTGPAFNPLAVAEPDLDRPLEERKAGGLGIVLVRKLMDTVRYERREGTNVLTLTKRVSLLSSLT
jgi:anti-sigma regulatory factor (Ser/Thr protein kinase)